MPTTVCEYPTNEQARLEALRRYDILDTPPDGNFEHLTQLAAYIFNVPIAIISLVDHDRIWFKSHFGLDVGEISRAPGLCASAILSNDFYIVGNAMEDPRTLANPLVTGALGLRFYAAAPLHTRDGYNLGTFCVIDKKPRFFTEQQQSVLSSLATIVMDQMELRLATRQYMTETQRQVQSSIAALAALNADGRLTSSIETLQALIHPESEQRAPR